MYCNACGREVAPGQNFCSSCGKPLEAVSAHIAVPNRIGQHIQVLSVLWIVYSLFSLIGAICLFFVSYFIFGIGAMQMRNAPPVPTFIAPLLQWIAIFLLAKGAAGVAAGWGLMQREEWARTLTLIVSFIALLNIPFGTALGIYSLWALFYPTAEQDYHALAARA